MVDWEDSGLRDPVREMGDLLYSPNQEDLLSPEEWQAFLTPYLAVQAARDPMLPRRIDLYRVMHPIFWLAWLFREGVHRAQRVRWWAGGSTDGAERAAAAVPGTDAGLAKRGLQPRAWGAGRPGAVPGSGQGCRILPFKTGCSWSQRCAQMTPKIRVLVLDGGEGQGCYSDRAPSK